MKLFIYGTLQEPSIQMALYGKTKEMKPAKLHDYAITNAITSDGLVSQYKTVAHVPDTKSIVDGVVIELDEIELRDTDEYESSPSFYQKKTVDIVYEDGTIEKCLTYINTHYLNKIRRKESVIDKTKNHMLSSNEFTKAFVVFGVELYVSKAYDEETDRHFLVNSIPIIPELKVEHIQFPVPFESEEERNKTFDELDLEFAENFINQIIEQVKHNYEVLQNKDEGDYILEDAPAEEVQPETAENPKPEENGEQVS